MDPPNRQQPKGQHGYSTRKKTIDFSSMVDEYDDYLKSPSPPPRPPLRKRVIQDLSPSDSSSSSPKKATEPTIVHPPDDEYADYFGDSGIGDPFEDPDLDDVTAIAIEKLTNTKKPYKKLEKQTIFKNALSVKKFLLLGPDPPQEVDDIYDMWCGSVRSFKSWDINTIASPMFRLAKYVAALKDEGTLPSRSSAAETLVTLYRCFRSAALQEVESQKAKNRRILSKVNSNKGKTNRGKTIPKEIDPISAHRTSEFAECPECKCEGSVIEVFTDTELEAKRLEWEADFAEKRKNNPKARRTGEPQMLYACMCARSKTLHGDWANSSWLSCRMRGHHDPECKMCNCACSDETFTMADVQQKAIKGVQKRNNSEKEQRKQTSGQEVLGAIFRDSISEVTSRLQNQPSSAGSDSVNTMTMIANEMKHKQFTSEHDMHLVQKMVGVPSSKLMSGEDVRSVVQQKNKKEYQNRLR